MGRTIKPFPGTLAKPVLYPFRDSKKTTYATLGQCGNILETEDISREEHNQFGTKDADPEDLLLLLLPCPTESRGSGNSQKKTRGEKSIYVHDASEGTYPDAK